MKVILTYCTPNPEDVIASAAAVCFSSDISPGANTRRIKNLMKMEHLSPLRFANASFCISEISRVTSHQLVRIAHAGILQRSQRYTTEQCDYVVPMSVAANHSVDYINFMSQAMILYNKMLDDGVPKEDARYILPQCIYTELNLTANFQTWRHFLKARLSQKAQWEIRAVANGIKAALVAMAPNIFEDL